MSRASTDRWMAELRGVGTLAFDLCVLEAILVVGSVDGTRLIPSKARDLMDCITNGVNELQKKSVDTSAYSEDEISKFMKHTLKRDSFLSHHIKNSLESMYTRKIKGALEFEYLLKFYICRTDNPVFKFNKKRVDFVNESLFLALPECEIKDIERIGIYSRPYIVKKVKDIESKEIY